MKNGNYKTNKMEIKKVKILARKWNIDKRSRWSKKKKSTIFVFKEESQDKENRTNTLKYNSIKLQGNSKAWLYI
jgi:hypothetical protein